MCESPDTKRLQFYDADDVSLNTLLAAMAPSDRRCPHVSESVSCTLNYRSRSSSSLLAK